LLGAGIFWDRLVGETYIWLVAGIPLSLCGVVGLVPLLVALLLWFGQTDTNVVNRSLRFRSSLLSVRRDKPASWE